MSGSIRRWIVVAALALPAVLATCSKSVEAPKIPSLVVQAFAGDGQPGLAGWAVNVRPAVKVIDSVGTVVVGASVTFAIASGGGSGTSLTTTTNGNGIAQVGSWVLGGSPGLNTMTATVTATGFRGSQATFSDSGFAAGYTITILPYGAGLSPAAQAAFDSAVAKWQRIIYRPLTPVNLSVPAGTCAPNTPAVNQTTTGVIILAAVDSIDGPGKTLAEAGPCEVRSSNGLAVFGVMTFDSADIGSLITSGRLSSIVLHEMNHVLGFGSLWGPPSGPVKANCIQLPSNPPGTLQDTYFSCPKGKTAFDSAGGLTYTGTGQGVSAGNKVPVENCATSPYVSPTCGAGTVNSHWREVVMTNELMTGFINAGTNPLSVFSVAADEDLGYSVNYAAADPYFHTFMAPPAGGAPAPLWLGNDVRRGPIYVVDARGAVVRVIPPR